MDALKHQEVLIEDTLALLEEELELLGSADNALSELHQALLKREATPLVSATEQQVQYEDVAQGLRGRRQRIMVRWSEHLQVPVEEVHLSRIAEQVPPPAADRLQALQRELTRHVVRVDRRRRQVVLLLGHSIELLQRTLERAGTESGTTQHYDAEGEVQSEQRGRMIQTDC